MEPEWIWQNHFKELMHSFPSATPVEFNSPSSAIKQNIPIWDPNMTYTKRPKNGSSTNRSSILGSPPTLSSPFQKNFNESKQPHAIILSMIFQNSSENLPSHRQPKKFYSILQTTTQKPLNGQPSPLGTRCPRF